jgi:hypothetical protein
MIAPKLGLTSPDPRSKFFKARAWKRREGQ